MSGAQAQTLKSQFHAIFPRLSQYTQDLKRRAKRDGAVGTMGGRHRPLPHIASSNAELRAKAERQSVNSVVQGSAADLMKEAMLGCVAALAQAGVRARLVCQLHDEVLFECMHEDASRCAKIVREQMEGIGRVGRQVLPRLPVSIECGQSWGTMVAMEHMAV